MLKKPWPDMIVEIICIHTISMMIAGTIRAHTIKITIIGRTDIIFVTNAIIARITEIETTNIMTGGTTGIHIIKDTNIRNITVTDTITAVNTGQVDTGRFV